MGTIIEFPRKPPVTCLQTAKHKARPQLAISNDPPGPPAQEFAFGYEEGIFAAHYQIASRAEFLALTAARHSGPVSFLREVQQCAFIQREPAAAAASLSEFSAYLYGRHGGGVTGQYAAGHRAAFALIEPFIAHLH